MHKNTKGLSDQKLNDLINELEVLANYRHQIQKTPNGILFLSPLYEKPGARVIYNHEALVWARDQKNTIRKVISNCE